jgi:RimJ/RimL family protein N-acetyltransferase
MGRFAIEGTSAVISVSLARDARGRGLGERLIALAGHRLFAETGVTRIDAWIRGENAASIRAFMAAGYIRPETRTTQAGSANDGVLLTYESAGRG